MKNSFSSLVVPQLGGGMGAGMECKNTDLYPDIWNFEEEDEIKENIISCFERIKDFYKQIPKFYVMYL